VGLCPLISLLGAVMAQLGLNCFAALTNLCSQFQFHRICFTHPAYFFCLLPSAASSAAMHINGGQWQVVCYAAILIRHAIRKWSTRDGKCICSL